MGDYLNGRLSFRGGVGPTKNLSFPYVVKFSTMKLTINGEAREVAALTLAALVEQLGMKPDRIAVELNRAIVRREHWASTELHEGDRLEIVHFVGGG